jgi:hypothetical protein
MQVSEPRHLIFEREVGGADCELTIICKPADDRAVDHIRILPAQKKAPCELTPDQAYICDHATD